VRLLPRRRNGLSGAATGPSIPFTGGVAMAISRFASVVGHVTRFLPNMHGPQLVILKPMIGRDAGPRDCSRD
jgi:hypothetical protein